MSNRAKRFLNPVAEDLFAPEEGGDVEVPRAGLELRRALARHRGSLEGRPRLPAALNYNGQNPELAATARMQ